MTVSDGPLILAAGPRDAETKLLDRIEFLIPKTPEALGSPIRVVVPSRSLRRHVLKVLADRFGSVVGVVVQTHRALALEVLERAGTELPAGGARVQDLLARSYAADEAVLQRDLVGFDDGFAPVAAAVRDLLDAGFGPEMFEPVKEALRDSAVSGLGANRAAAVVKVAATCQVAAKALGLAHRGSLHELASRALCDLGDSILPSRAVLIHGFAEATGLLSKFLEALVQQCRAQVVMDHPPNPVKPAGRDSGRVFTQRLTDRLCGVGSGNSALEPEPGTLQREVNAFTAPGHDAEIREVVDRVIRLHQAGTPWEDIAIVQRSLPAITVNAVRRHFARLGVPFSGEGSTATGGRPARRAAAVDQILSLGLEARVGALFEAGGRSLPMSELDIAFRTLGVSRVGQFEELDLGSLVGGGELKLPVVERVEDSGTRINRIRRRVPRWRLEEAVSGASALIELLKARPDQATIGEYFIWLGKVQAELAGDGQGDPSIDPVRRALARLEDELPNDLVVTWSALQASVSRALEGLEAVPLGGQGGGVQVLTVMEARGRTFEHLFIIGLNRGVFPVQGADDPVFSTEARRAVAAELLLELPLKDRDRPEERYLFAQLMAAAPAVTLSWQRVDADGKELNPSVFVERLRLGGVLSWDREGKREDGRADEPGEVVGAPDVFEAGRPREIRPPLELSVIEGLEEKRSPVFFSTVGRLGGPDSRHLRAVLDELDPPAGRSDLGPFLGLVGLRPGEEIWVTRLETHVQCPWKTFLERELGLEPPPEASFSDEGVGGAMVGSVVHSVLERLASSQGVPDGSTLDEVRPADGTEVLWPSEGWLRTMVIQSARPVAADRGVPWIWPALAGAAMGYLDRVRDLAWPEGAVIAGVEAKGRTVFGPSGVPGEHGITVSFKADRVDRAPDGHRLILIDYKTGKPGSGPSTVIPRGRLLQGAVYALSDLDIQAGRYVYLAEGVKEGKEIVDITPELAENAIEVVRTVVGSWREGVLFPRLCSPDGSGEGDSCRWCDLKAACLHGDSGVGGRMVAAFDAMAEDSSLRAHWLLPEAGKPRRGSDS